VTSAAPCYFFYTLKTVPSVTVSALIAWQKNLIGLGVCKKRQEYLSVDLIMIPCTKDYRYRARFVLVI